MHGCWQFHHEFYRFGAASYAIEKCIFVDLQLKGCIEFVPLIASSRSSVSACFTFEETRRE